MSSQDRSGADSRKKAVSIRINRGDARNIKRVAERLGARDSDVIRFAIKLMLGKLSPLQDPAVRGRNLVPVFLESGPDLIRHFELDAARLAGIINEGVEEDHRVDPDDVQLIAMSGLQRAYLKLRVAGFRRAPVNEVNASGQAVERSVHESNGDARSIGDADPLEQSLRQYLYEKYLYVSATEPTKIPA